MVKIYLFLIASLLTGIAASGQSLVINELMASNNTTIADATGDFEDWIELYNPTGATIDLTGYYITDKPNKPTKYKLPTGVSIGPNSYLLLWASESPSRGNTHVDFKLSVDGEYVGVYKPDGTTLVDEITFGPQRADIAWGRRPNGSGSWVFLRPGTPGASNTTATAYQGFLNEPEFSQAAGFYTSCFNLALSTSEPGSSIYYTLDGSEPDPADIGGKTFQYKNRYEQLPGQAAGPLLNSPYKSWLYSAPITISDRSSQPNKLSIHASSYHYDPDYIPSFPVFKGTVVRAKVVKNGFLSSDIVSKTFVVTPLAGGRFTLPVIGITIPPKKLFDYQTGIYTAGVTFDNWRATDATTSAYGGGYPANFRQTGSNWEVEANIEFFSDNNQEVAINQPIGLRIHGGFSRSNAQKGLRLYSSSHFDYPFFPNQPNHHQTLLLRAAGNDWRSTMMRDGMYQTAVKHLRFDTQGYRPSVVLLNGEYWGIHNLRERYDRFYLVNKYQIAEDSMDLIENNFSVDEGDILAYDNLIDHLVTGVQGQDYENVLKLMDTDNFIDYQIAEIYVSNTDWVENNIRCWRKRVNVFQPDAAYGHDGRWRWMMYDTDYGMNSGPAHDGLAFATNNGPSTYPAPVRSFPLRRLLENQTFREQFINRYADLLNTTFLPSRMMQFISQAKAKIQPEMPEQIGRWKHPSSIPFWESEVQKMVDFVQQRPPFARQHIRNKFSLSGEQNLTVNISAGGGGYVKVNSIDLVSTTEGVSAMPYPWTGVYFRNVPVKLTAKTNSGSAFIRWTEGGATISTDPVLILNLTANRSLVAEFVTSNVCRSIKSGNWHTSSTWDCGRVPNATVEVVVRNNHIVSVSTADADALALQLQDNGKLDVNTNRKLTLWKAE